MNKQHKKGMTLLGNISLELRLTSRQVDRLISKVKSIHINTSKHKLKQILKEHSNG
jgi:hypothetical protein